MSLSAGRARLGAIRCLFTKPSNSHSTPHATAVIRSRATALPSSGSEEPSGRVVTTDSLERKVGETRREWRMLDPAEKGGSSKGGTSKEAPPMWHVGRAFANDFASLDWSEQVPIFPKTSPSSADARRAYPGGGAWTRLSRKGSPAWPTTQWCG